MSLQDKHLFELQEIMGILGQYYDLDDFKIALEVGSRDAVESINMKQFLKNAKIFAFECNPEAILICEKNLTNKVDIFLEKYAVSDISGKIQFYPIDPLLTKTTHKDGNIGASSLFKPNPEYPYEKYVVNEIIVDAITINEWAFRNKIKNIDFMWIDVQGAELNVLKGMSNYLNDVKAIYIEVEFKEIWIGQPLFNEINQHLKKLGFRLVKLYGLNDWFGNVLLININKVNFFQKLKINLMSCFLSLFLKVTKRM